MHTLNDLLNSLIKLFPSSETKKKSKRFHVIIIDKIR